MKRIIFVLVAVMATLFSQAQVKISSLPVKTDYGDSTWVPIVDNGVNKRIQGHLLAKVRIDSLVGALNGKQGSLGFTPVTNARKLTINGVEYDLSADRNWDIETGSADGKTKVSTVAGLRASAAPDNDSAVFYLNERGFEGWWYYDPDDVSTADDTATTIVGTGNARFKRIFFNYIYPEWWGATGDGTTDDGPAFNRMYRWIERTADRSYEIAHKNRKYRINTSIYLPKMLTSAGEFLRFKINGNGVTYSTTAAINVMYRRPDDNTEAVDEMIGAYALTIEGLRIVGNNTAGQVGINLGALYTPIIRECYFNQLDTGAIGLFWLNAVVENNFFGANTSVGFKGASGEGYWSGATTSNSAFNANKLEGNRVYNSSGAFAGIYMLATDGLEVVRHISEGGNPRYDIYNDSQGSPVVNGNSYRSIWFESNGAGNNICFYIRNNGTTRIEDIQNDYQDTLLKVVTPAGSSHFVFENIQYYNIFDEMIDAGGTYHSGVTMEVNNCAPFFAKIFTDAQYWVDDIVGFEGASFTKDEFKTVNSNLTIKPNNNNAVGNRLLFIDGSVYSNEDNVNYFTLGGNYTGGFQSRFHTGWFGDGGLWVTTSGKFGFGSASNDADYLTRPAAGRYLFNGTGQLGIPKGTTAQQLVGALGDIRGNTDSTFLEYWDGSTFRGVASRNWVWSNFLTTSSYGSVASNIISDANNTRDIGSTGNRWKKGWFVDADISGDLTVTGNIGTVPSSALTEQPWVSAFQYMGSNIKAGPIGVDWQGATTTTGMVDGRMFLIPIWVNESKTLTGIKWAQITQGSYTPDNSNQVGLYSMSAGSSTITLVASSTSSGTLWSTGVDVQSAAFTTPVAVTRGVYYIALLYNSSAQTTGPAILSSATASQRIHTMDFTNGHLMTGYRGSSSASLLSTYDISTATEQTSVFFTWAY